MLISPFAYDKVFSSISHGVVNLIVVVSQVFNENFLARTLRTVNSHVNYVVS